MQRTLNFDKDMDCTHPPPSLELGNAVKKLPDCLFGHENQAGCCGFRTRVSLGDSGIKGYIIPYRDATLHPPDKCHFRHHLPAHLPKKTNS